MDNDMTPSNETGTRAPELPIQSVLQEATQPVWWKKTWLWALTGLLVLGGVGLYFWQANANSNAAPVYVTEPVARGNLTLSVTANGTLQPTRSVSIGSELSGTVRKVNVDVNDRIKKGQVLVELDTAKLTDQVSRSRAALASANARVAQAVVSVREAQGNLARFEEVARLSGGKVPSKAELDTAQAAFERAQADETSARADVASARAAASTDETNLSKSFIRSPIDGVVLTRSVDPGNAVAASLQAVTLFTVAEDLTKLRLQVNVDEADVGSVKAGQKASFTVSAYPTRKYPATITRVAFGSTVTENVVTYVTYLEVSNPDLSLRPGMTASSTITATELRDVLLVPNTALRFSPTKNAGGPKGSIVSSLMPRMPGGPARKTAGGVGAAKQVWVLRDGAPVVVAVTTGISDGRMTEVTSGELTAGMAVITDQRTAGAAP
jgi:HlyD family secretion protein